MIYHQNIIRNGQAQGLAPTIVTDIVVGADPCVGPFLCMVLIMRMIENLEMIKKYLTLLAFSEIMLKFFLKKPTGKSIK